MNSIDELKIAMDELITIKELELSQLKQSRNMLNANPIPIATPLGLKPNLEFLPLNHNISTQHSIETGRLIKQEANGSELETDKRKGRKKAEIPTEYPLHGDGTVKLRYIMHCKNRAVSEVEFRKEIVRHEGAGSNMLASLDRILRGMAHPEKGEWTYFTFKKKGVKFFVHPDWYDAQNKTVIPMRRTDVTLSDLNPNECNWSHLIWHQDK